ncbi:trigger factor [Verrucomicrobiaceae bacterium N1E253]|uniref:Trigger factor n=1 Tax=Oceaniferula marina TaxID=2748318 RepID=A0A851GA46_9BACT|nr:trigger factor [Oceaniferula marina]NWK54286.1 trigger factor [Oceaniferula marina]
MNITVEKQPECTATLRAEFPADHVSSERKKIVKGYASQAKIPGFRPGKTPVSVIEKRFGDAIKEELESRLINDACSGAVKQEEDLKVLQFKNPESINHNDDGTFAFVMPLILAPTFELPEYKGIEVKLASAEASEEEIQRELDGVLERYADYKEIEDRPLQTDDIAVIDFTSTLEGKPLEEALGKPAGILGGKEDYWVRIQEDAFLPGFSEQLEGASIGDSREVTCAVGDDFPLEDIQGKELVFAVTVKGIKEQNLPELDDAFVADTLQFGEGKTVDDLKELISDQVKMQKERQIEESKVNQIVEQLIERVDFELPQELVTAEAQGSADDMVARGAQAGLSDEEIEAQQADIIATAQIQARNNLKTNFILQEIAAAEDISVSEQDLLQRISAMAQQEKKPVKSFIRELQKSGRINGLQNSMLIGKAIDFLVENAQIEELANEEEAEA